VPWPRTPKPTLLRAACGATPAQAAFLFLKAGYSVIPLKGKEPAVRWKTYMSRLASQEELEGWIQSGKLQNLGIVCGAISHNLVVLDLDGRAACAAFATTFPHLSQTFTVLTGSRRGKHLYFHVRQLPPTAMAIDTRLGNLELRSEGHQVVVPPSWHPDTGQQYRVLLKNSILEVEDLAQVVSWINHIPVNKSGSKRVNRRRPATFEGRGLDPGYMQPVIDHFMQLGYAPNGAWLNGQCIYPEQHNNRDRRASFGYNTSSGYGYCWRCGSMTTRDIARQLGIPLSPPQ